MPTSVREVTTDEAWDDAVPIIRQLWSHRDGEFVRSWREEDDYRLFGLYESGGWPSDAAESQGQCSDPADPREPGETDPAGPGETDPADPNERGELVAVAGISVQRVFHHERHVWIHDFVVDEPRRGEGLGTELLRWVEDWGRERDCESVALGCVDDNDAARAFYEDQGLGVWGQVMEREL